MIIPHSLPHAMSLGCTPCGQISSLCVAGSHAMRFGLLGSSRYRIEEVSESFGGCLPVEGLSWAAVEFVSDRSRRAALWRLRSVPLGKYWRSSPLVFSLVPRCHGDGGIAEVDVDAGVELNWAWRAISLPWSQVIERTQRGGQLRDLGGQRR